MGRGGLFRCPVYEGGTPGWGRAGGGPSGGQGEGLRRCRGDRLIIYLIQSGGDMTF